MGTAEETSRGVCVPMSCGACLDNQTSLDLVHSEDSQSKLFSCPTAIRKVQVCAFGDERAQSKVTVLRLLWSALDKNV